MNRLKIQQETRELYQDAGIKTLKGLIFLTLCTRNLSTRHAIFILSAIVPFITSLYMYSMGVGLVVFPTAMVVHFFICKIAYVLAEKDGMQKDYEEQDIIYRELKVILDEKRKLRY